MPLWLFCLSILAALPIPSWADVLVGRRVWSGTVRVEEDVLVPPGSSLEILPGTRVIFAVSPGTKTDPGFWTSGTELAVEGALAVRGTDEAPVTFEGEGAWGGIVSAPGASVLLSGARIQGAQEGLLCVGSECALTRLLISGGEYGLVLGPGARASADQVVVEGARVGVLDLRGPQADALPVEVRGAGDVAGLFPGTASAEFASTVPAFRPERSVELVGDYTVERDETWSGEVVVSGKVTVVPGAVLTLTPGTRVAFRRRDTNGDGLGEGELIVLGGIRCRGTAGSPVVFESAEADPAAGDWDKVSLISSEDAANEFRYAVFRHGTQALHAHFSSFSALDCYFESNLRGVQFQECGDVRLRRCVFRANKQALRFRDSHVDVSECVFAANLYAVHAFRCELRFLGNTLEANALGGFFARESKALLVGNRFVRNRDGARLREQGDGVQIDGNRFEGNAEDGLSLAFVGGSVTGNAFEGAGLDLVATESSSAAFRGNRFGAAGRDAFHLKGPVDVVAQGNDWGAAEPASRIHDGEDVPSLGRVLWSPAAERLDLSAVPKARW